jgi:hypothetical protein
MRCIISIVLLCVASPALAFVQPVVRAETARRFAGRRPAAAKDEDGVRYGVDVPYREAAYDPTAAAAFFRGRPLASFRRIADLARLSGSFVALVAADKALKRDGDEAVVAARSQQLLELVTKLGPTFIKVGQALSIRTDLLPAPYVAGLTQLQDAVPPFDGARGRAIIERELGVDLDATFRSISLEPVASASIGQVYRGTLRATGEDVAVKVRAAGRTCRGAGPCRRPATPAPHLKMKSTAGAAAGRAARRRARSLRFARGAVCITRV